MFQAEETENAAQRQQLPAVQAGRGGVWGGTGWGWGEALLRESGCRRVRRDVHFRKARLSNTFRVFFLFEREGGKRLMK